MKKILSLIFSLLFWIPIIGTVFSAIALALGISAYKEEKEHTVLPLLSIILSVIGLILPVLFIFLIFFQQSLVLEGSNIFRMLESQGIFDVWIPFILMTLLSGMILFFILEIIKLKTLRNYIISITVGTLISLGIAIPHIIGSYSGPDSDVVNTINQALPAVMGMVIIIVAILLVLYVFAVRKKK